MFSCGSKGCACYTPEAPPEDRAFRQLVTSLRKSKGEWCSLPLRLLRKVGREELFSSDKVRDELRTIQKLRVLGTHANGPPLVAEACSEFLSNLDFLRFENCSKKLLEADLDAVVAMLPSTSLEVEDTQDNDDEYSSSARSIRATPVALSWLAVLEKVPRLRVTTLKLQGCGLDLAPETACAPNLEVLSLRRNRLTSARQLCDAVRGLENLRVLDVAENDLRSETFTPWIAIGSAHTLNLADNRLTSLRGLELCLGIVDLDLSNNDLPSMDDLALLSALPLLNTISLKGNPLCAAQNTTNYRVAAFTALARDDRSLRRKAAAAQLSSSLKTTTMATTRCFSFTTSKAKHSSTPMSSSSSSQGGENFDDNDLPILDGKAATKRELLDVARRTFATAATPVSFRNDALSYRAAEEYLEPEEIAAFEHRRRPQQKRTHKKEKARVANILNGTTEKTSETQQTQTTPSLQRRDAAAAAVTTPVVAPKEEEEEEAREETKEEVTLAPPPAPAPLQEEAEEEKGPEGGVEVSEPAAAVLPKTLTPEQPGRSRAAAADSEEPPEREEAEAFAAVPRVVASVLPPPAKTTPSRGYERRFASFAEENLSVVGLSPSILRLVGDDVDSFFRNVVFKQDSADRMSYEGRPVSRLASERVSTTRLATIAWPEAPSAPRALIDVRGRVADAAYHAGELSAILVVTSLRLFVFLEEAKLLDATIRDAPTPKLIAPPQELASLASATIGFKFDWLAFDFDGGLNVTFPTHSRDATLSLVNAVVPVAKELRAAKKGLRGDAGRRGAVTLVNDDNRTLDLLASVAFEPNNDADGVPLLYASCVQFWKSKGDLTAPRVLVVTNKRLYLVDDDLGAFSGGAVHEENPAERHDDAARHRRRRRDRQFQLLESLPWRRARSVQLADDPGLPCELTLTFVDPSYHAGFFKNWRTWRLRFAYHTLCHAACDLIQARLHQHHATTTHYSNSSSKTPSLV